MKCILSLHKDKQYPSLYVSVCLLQKYPKYIFGLCLHNLTWATDDLSQERDSPHAPDNSALSQKPRRGRPLDTARPQAHQGIQALALKTDYLCEATEPGKFSSQRHAYLTPETSLRSIL